MKEKQIFEKVCAKVKKESIEKKSKNSVYPKYLIYFIVQNYQQYL